MSCFERVCDGQRKHGTAVQSVTIIWACERHREAVVQDQELKIVAVYLSK
jgi:hypothetical protein